MTATVDLKVTYGGFAGCFFRFKAREVSFGCGGQAAEILGGKATVEDLTKIPIAGASNINGGGRKSLGGGRERNLLGGGGGRSWYI
ncbi:hypothetical protein Bca4012_058618 [Brassica carinata]